MAYDRYDTQRGRDRSRELYGERGGRRDDRGFFERAGDEIASWFGDDDDDRERSDRGRYDRGRFEHSDRSRGWAAERGWGGDPDRNRSDRGADRSRFGDDNFERGYRGREGGYRPMTGDYGRFESERGSSFSGRPSMRSHDMDRSTSSSRESSGREHDRHYSEWRKRQLDALDRDYDEYHRERQQHFENDFGSWRQNRQSKRQMLSQAREHMNVVGSDGETIGKIDRVAGDRVILTKSDSPDGRHHSIPCSMIDKVEDEKLVLDCTAEQAQKRWRDDSRERALFEREDQGESGPHMLDRSFSGTYRD